MEIPFVKTGARGLLLSQIALAALLFSLPSCSGGASEKEGQHSAAKGFDISPHDLVPDGAVATQLSILGVHVTQDGWEIGSDPDWDGPPPLDATENPLTMVFEADGDASNSGSVTVTLPFQSVTDDPDVGPPTMTGRWWQEPRAGKQDNTVMYINFTVAGNVHGVDCTGKGDNICLLLRTYNTADPRGFLYVGAVMSGTFTLYGLFHESSSQGPVPGEQGNTKVISPTSQLLGQPCRLIISGWEPEELP
ncbi:MAG: hypothetical protein Q3986_07870 [Akkermansia sp.]|nr:hypothetical protein [Akkermansia sp.]